MGSEELKNIAIRAAYSAGEILKYHYGKLTQINKKGSIDLVTAADISSEKAIITTIKNAFPDHLIIPL